MRWLTLCENSFTSTNITIFPRSQISNSAIVAPPRASTPQDVEKILSDWKHQIHPVQLHDKNFQVPDDLKATLLHGIMPKSFQETMRARQERMDDKGRNIQPRLPQVRTETSSTPWKSEEWTKKIPKPKGVHGLASTETNTRCPCPRA